MKDITGQLVTFGCKLIRKTEWTTLYFSWEVEHVIVTTVKHFRHCEKFSFLWKYKEPV